MYGLSGKEPGSEPLSQHGLTKFKEPSGCCCENKRTHRHGGYPPGSIWFPANPTAWVGLSTFEIPSLITYKLLGYESRKGSTVLARSCPCSPPPFPSRMHFYMALSAEETQPQQRFYRSENIKEQIHGYCLSMLRFQFSLPWHAP